MIEKPTDKAYNFISYAKALPSRKASSTRIVHSEMQEVKRAWEKASMDEQGIPEWAQWKNEVHRRRKWGWATWEEYRDVTKVCRYVVGKTKAQLELEQVKDGKANKSVFCKYTGSKRKMWDHCGNWVATINCFALFHLLGVIKHRLQTVSRLNGGDWCNAILHGKDDGSEKFDCRLIMSRVE